MKKNIINLSVVTFISIAFAGCGIKFSMEDSLNHKLHEENLNEKESSGNLIVEGYDIPDLEKKYKSKKVKKKSISLKYSLSLRDAIKKLQKIDGRKYFIDLSVEDFLIPPSDMTVSSFRELRDYILYTMDKEIYFSKNSVMAKKLKIINVRDSKEREFDLKKVEFDLNGELTVTEALERLSKSPVFDFSIIIDVEDFELNMVTNQSKRNIDALRETSRGVDGSAKQTTNKIFEKTYVNFKGNTVADFFSYLEEKLNIFVNIDYKKKTVTLKKYEKFTFDITVPNLNISMNSSDGKSVTSDSDAVENPISETSQLAPHINLKESFDMLITDAKTRGNTNAYYLLDSSAGLLTVNADRKTVYAFNDIIKKLNTSYNTMIEVKIVSFDLIFSKTYALETGLFAQSTSGETIGVKSSIDDNVRNVLSADQKDNNGWDINVLFDSASTMGYITKKDIQKYVLRNNIPKSKNNLQSQRYIKNIIVSEPTTDGGSQQITTETDNISQSNGYNISANYINGLITVNLKTHKGELIRIDKLATGDNAINSPVTESSNDSDNFIIRNGETLLTTSEIRSVKSKDLEGNIPSDWLAANLLTGGKTGDDVLYSQKIRVVRAIKINNL